MTKAFPPTGPNDWHNIQLITEPLRFQRLLSEDGRPVVVAQVEPKPGDETFFQQIQVMRAYTPFPQTLEDFEVSIALDVSQLGQVNAIATPDYTWVVASANSTFSSPEALYSIPAPRTW